MNSATINYKLTPFTGILGHLAGRSTLMRDGADTAEVDYKVDLQARSGDYFVTLATELDQLGSTIEDYRTRAAIEEIVSDLIYLQDNYAIIRQSNSN